VTGIYARWHMFEEKRDAVMAIEAAALPLMPSSEARAAYGLPVDQLPFNHNDKGDMMV
jgi:hypothetical protein